MGVWVNQCSSEGELRLTSPDPEVHPVIDEGMLRDERDVVRIGATACGAWPS